MHRNPPNRRIAIWRKTCTILRRFVLSHLVWAAAALIVVGLALPSFAERVGDAFVVAGLISLLLDGPAKAAISNALFEGALWSIISPNAPEYHRTAILGLASAKTVVDSAEWRIRIDPDDGDPALLRLVISLQAWGCTYEQADNFPQGKVPVLASSDGRRSRYLKWEMRSGNGDLILSFGEADFARAEADETFVQRRDDGGVVFDIAAARALSNGQRNLGVGDRFTRTSEVEVFRHRRGFSPMWSNFTTEKTTIKLEGAALHTYNFTLARLDKTHVDQWQATEWAI